MICSICWDKNCGCEESLVEIDEDILDTVIDLNRKGYVTLFSCQGDDTTTPYVVICSRRLPREVRGSLLSILHGRALEYSPMSNFRAAIYAHDYNHAAALQRLKDFLAKFPIMGVPHDF